MRLARHLALLACAALLFAAPGCQKGSDSNKDEKDKDKAEKARDAGSKTSSARKRKSMRPRQADIPAPPDVAAPPPDTKKTPGGVAYKILSAKPGAQKPGPNDTVVIHYTGWTTDGEMFDSSVARKHPARFPLGNIIPGMTEGMQQMGVGEKARMWIPEKLAYEGKRGAPQGMLVFDIELQEVVKAPETPSDVGKPPQGARKTKSGLFYRVLAKGTGKDKPATWDRVKVQYSGWTADGKMFDSSVTKGRPGEYALENMMPGWSEGIQTMVVGQKSRFWIPEELAYKGKPGRPSGMLTYDTELVEIVKMPAPPSVPKDVAAPPSDAKKTESGVAYKVLKKGTGKEHPTRTSKVKVHYTGWTTDGKMFDSSVTRGKPITFGLEAVIPGWTEGLQTMVEGEKTRLWIPEQLAYAGKPGRPQGMLVFEVELIEILPGRDEAPQTK
jgi:FKBP-type peptidyl-prolyl cis-trans isomerase